MIERGTKTVRGSKELTMKNNLFYDSVPAELRGEGPELQLESAQYFHGTVTNSKAITVAEVSKAAAEFNESLEKLSYFDAIELFRGR